MRSPGLHACAASFVLALAVCATAADARRPDPASPWDPVIAAATNGADSADARRRVELALAPNADPAARLEVLLAISRADAPSPALLPMVSGVLEQPVDADTLIAALKAMSGFRDKAAVRAVISYARSARDLSRRIDVYETALATLQQQTGLAARSTGIEGWEEWYEEASALGPADWSARIAANHAERSRRSESLRLDAEARLAGVYRRLLVTLPDAERSRCIAEMIASPAAEVRALGVDQATRAVLNAQSPGAEVAQAAIARLADESQSVRSEMAGLLEKLDDPAIAPALRTALARESEPVPAASILRALSRHPDAGARRDIIVWLDAQEPAFTPAVDAALALDRVSELIDPETNARIAEVLGSLPRSRHTAGSATLLARVAGPGAVAHLVAGGPPDAALAAARALAQSEPHTDELVRAALANAALFEPAVESLSRHRRHRDGFTLAESLPADRSERRDRALAEFARSLPPGDLLAVCERQPDLGARERYASVCDAPGYFAPEMRDPDARRGLAALLARARLAMKNPEGAAAVLDAACPDAASCSALASLRVTALAWAGKVSRAVEVSRAGAVPISAWFEALDAAAALPHGREISAAIREVYSTALTPGDIARLEAGPGADTP